MAPSRVITFKADEELVERMDRLAQRKGLTRSEVIRRAIIMYLRMAESED